MGGGWWAKPRYGWTNVNTRKGERVTYQPKKWRLTYIVYMNVSEISLKKKKWVIPSKPITITVVFIVLQFACLTKNCICLYKTYIDKCKMVSTTTRDIGLVLTSVQISVFILGQVTSFLNTKCKTKYTILNSG